MHGLAGARAVASMILEDGLSLEVACGSRVPEVRYSQGVIRGPLSMIARAAPFLMHVVLDVGQHQYTGADAVRRLAYWAITDFRSQRSAWKHPFAVSLPSAKTQF